jgi:hypothetical protein
MPLFDKPIDRPSTPEEFGLLAVDWDLPGGAAKAVLQLGDSQTAACNGA